MSKRKPFNVGKLTNAQLHRLIRHTRDQDLAELADSELSARQDHSDDYGSRHDDTPSIDWQGWNSPGTY